MASNSSKWGKFLTEGVQLGQLVQEKYGKKMGEAGE